VKRIWSLKPDVIHALNWDMLLAARLAAFMLRSTKVVFALQDTTEWMLHPIAKAVQRWAYRGADVIIVTSKGFEARFLRRFNLISDEKKVVFVPNVPPLQQFARFEPHPPGESLTVGYIGLLRGEEGIRSLVSAAGLARNRGAKVRVLFAGKGTGLDLVEELAEKHTYVDYIGPYRHEDILDIYSEVDVLYGVYDRSYDKKIHLAYRLCEAVNCRLPLIVAKGSHMADVVETHGIGVSFELGDVDGLAGELVEFYHSHEKRNRIASNCERVRTQFVFETYQDRILEAYDGLWGSVVQHGTTGQAETLPAGRTAKE